MNASKVTGNIWKIERERERERDAGKEKERRRNHS